MCLHSDSHFLTICPRVGKQSADTDAILMIREVAEVDNPPMVKPIANCTWYGGH